MLLVTAGNAHTCVVIPGSGANGAFCWGDNSSMQIGAASNGKKVSSPIVYDNYPSSGDPHDVELVAGGDVVFARSGDQWESSGSNGSGQLADGTTTDKAAAKPIGLTGAQQIAIGDRHACALFADGSVKCWGDDSVGQLGDGAFGEQHTPVAVKF